jgi:hypothetical protein
VLTPDELNALAAAPLFAMIVEIPALHRWRPWKRELLRLALVSIPIIVAVIPAAIQFQKDSAASSGLEM